jgi:hypothetical protein
MWHDDMVLDTRGKFLLDLPGKIPADIFAVKNWTENITEGPICHLVKTHS